MSRRVSIGTGAEAARRRGWLIRPAIVAVLGSALVLLSAGCAGGTSADRDSASAARVIDAGIVGTLPPRSRDTRPVALTLPRGVVRVRGSFPLGSIVRFRVPMRNDGAKALSLKRAESG